MAYYTKNQINHVKQMDLLSYLKNYEPDELIKKSDSTYITKTHDSLVISNGLWNWFSRGIGGKSALDYLIKVRDYSFKEAMNIILNHEKIETPTYYKYAIKEEQNDLKKLNLTLPTKANDNEKAINYLLKRGIDKDIIDECIDNETIFQDKNNNVVFVGMDKNNTARYGFIRGTLNNNFKGECYGSHKAFSFKLDSINKNDTLHLFESAIDLLSYATLLKLENKEWYNENLLSLAGVYRPARNIEESTIPLALKYYLNQHQNISKIILHLDNDITGREASFALKTILSSRYKVIDDPPRIGKDVNDFLCKKLKINYKERYEKER
ncbi:MAG: DUF3991 and TOPRIM domain-containing protein [bacterium]|nr:DUF3991 and TOPRIM domain-containing protein [bacterium]